MLPIFLDIEASSLSENSYPIEVAWNYPGHEIENHLINPEHIKEWNDWSEASQLVHGISREHLSTHGESPFDVAKRMNLLLANHKIYSDAADYDAFWIDQLFKAVNQKRLFLIRDFYSLLPDEIVYGGWMGNSNMLNSYQKQARERAGVPAHRASNDVKYLIELYSLGVYHY